jgi:hypothetical protein
MSWKFLSVLVATIAFCVCTPLMAQHEPGEAFLGIWQINAAKTSNYPQQNQMIINLPGPDGGFVSIRATIGKDGKSSSETHPVVFDGKPHQTDGGDPREISYKLIDPHTIERTQNRNGKVSVDTEQVSNDGKTLTVTQANAMRIYDKQFSVQPIAH